MQVLFQFQDGSIKCFQHLQVLSVKKKFQFQDGSIKCLIPLCPLCIYDSFNSKMVRLNAILGVKNV